MLKRTSLPGDEQLDTINAAARAFFDQIGFDLYIFPSYLTLQALTDRCHGAIAAAIRRLEHARIIKVTRRLKRIWIDRTSPITGRLERMLVTVQDSNLYAFTGPASLAGRINDLVETCAAPRRGSATSSPVCFAG